MISPDVYVHESSYIDSDVTIGPRTKIWHFCHLMRGTKVGSDCVFGQNVMTGSNVRIGDSVKIQNNVSIYEGVEIENDVFCGPSMVFTNVLIPRGAISRKHEFRPTLEKQGATLGANCTIVCGHTIGRHAFVAAGAVITKDVPDFALMVGVPARRAGWVCECGIGLTHHPNPICTACDRRYEIRHEMLRQIAIPKSTS